MLHLQIKFERAVCNNIVFTPLENHIPFKGFLVVHLGEPVKFEEYFSIRKVSKWNPFLEDKNHLIIQHPKRTLKELFSPKSVNVSVVYIPLLYLLI